MLTGILSRLSAITDGFGWQRKFTVLWSGTALSQWGSATASVASPLLALQLSGSAIFAGWVAAAGTLPGVLLQLPAGFLVDRIRRRRQLMALSQAFRLIAILAFALALFCSEVPHLYLLAMVTVNGVCGTVYSLAEVTSVRTMVPEPDRGSATVKDEVRGHISQVAGRSAGGFLFGVSHALPYLVEAVTSLLTLTALFFMGTIKRADPAPLIQTKTRGFSLRQVTEVYQTIRRDEYLSQVIIVCATANFLLQTLILLLLVWARESNYSSTEIGFLMASSGFFGVLGSIATEKWLSATGDRARKNTTYGFIAWILLMIALCVSPSAGFGLVCWGMFSVVGAYVNIALRCRQTEVIPEESLGRVTSLSKFITGGATALGALVAGYAVDSMSPLLIMVLATVFLTLAVLVVNAKGSTSKTVADSHTPAGRAAPENLKSPHPTSL